MAAKWFNSLNTNSRRTCWVQKLFWMSETISVQNVFSPGLSLEFSCIEFEQSVIILWVCWRKNKSFWQRFTCSHRGNLGNIWKSSLGFSHVEISFGNLVRFKSVSFWPEDRCLLRQFLLWFLICFLLRKRAKTFNFKTQLFKVLITQPFWRLRFQLFLSCQLEFSTDKSLSEALFFFCRTRGEHIL